MNTLDNEDLTPTELLMARRDELAFGPTQWVPRSPYGEPGKACLIVGGSYPIRGLAVVWLQLALGARCGLPAARYAYVPAWNDHPGRTLDEVLDVLDDAIRLSKEMDVKLRFIRERETKNTIRFSEQPEPGKPPVIGTVYIQKWAVADLGEELLLSIEGTGFHEETI